jgi:hypothetical protein
MGRVALTARITAALCLFGLLVWAPSARAFERQWHLGGDLGAATFADGETTAGPLVGVHAAYGLSDMFDLRADAFASFHTLKGETFGMQTASVGLAYKFDVFTWVPYAGLSVGYYHLGREVRPEPLAEHELGLSADLGLDYSITREFGLGVLLRSHGFASDPLEKLRSAPLFTAALRAEYRWGW